MVLCGEHSSDEEHPIHPYGRVSLKIEIHFTQFGADVFISQPASLQVAPVAHGPPLRGTIVPGRCGVPPPNENEK